MIYINTILIGALLLSGCASEEEKSSKVYKDFVAKNKSSSRYYCDENTGFFMQEYFYSSEDVGPTPIPVKNDSDTPVRCSNDVDITVKETVATGSFSGSVQ